MKHFHCTNLEWRQKRFFDESGLLYFATANSLQSNEDVGNKNVFIKVLAEYITSVRYKNG